MAEVLAAEQGQKVRPRRWWKFWERRVPPPDIENIENPELRAIIEGLYRWAFDHDRAIALLSGVAAARRGSRRDGFFRDVPEGVR